MYYIRQIQDLKIVGSNVGRVTPKVVMVNGNYVFSSTIIKNINDVGNTEVSIIDEGGDLQGGITFSNVVVPEFSQNSRELCVLSNQNTVFVWVSELFDGSGFGVQARIEGVNGTVVKDNFRVNSHVKLNQNNPTIAALKEGFVIVWQSLGQDNNKMNNGVFAQIFNSDGDFVGKEFKVNDYVPENQEKPVIICNKNGVILIAWNSYRQDGSGNGVYAKLYNDEGVEIAKEFLVNTKTKNDQEHPSVAVLDDGSFVITWQGARQNNKETHDIYMQLVSDSGVKLGKEELVNNDTTNDQQSAHVFAMPYNSFAITWQDVSSSSVMIKAYSVSQSNMKTILDDTKLSGIGGVDINTSSLRISNPVGLSRDDGTILIAGHYVDQETSNYQVIIWMLEGSDFKGGVVMQQSTESQIPHTTDSVNYVTNGTNSTDVNTTTLPVDVINNITNSTFTDTTTAPLPVEDKTHEVMNTAETTPASVFAEQTTSFEKVTLINQGTASQAANSTEDSTIQQPAANINAPKTETLNPVQSSAADKVTTAPKTEQSTEATSVASNDIAGNKNNSTGNATIVSNETLVLTEESGVSSPDITNKNDHLYNNTDAVNQSTINATNSSNTTLQGKNSIPGPSNKSPDATAKIILNNFTSLEVIFNQTTVELNATSPMTFIFSETVKFARIDANGMPSNFVFSASEDSIILINGFGDNAILNFTNFPYRSISDFNITIGSTHFHLPYNQTIVIMDKYPNDLNEKNFAFASNTSFSEASDIPDNSTVHKQDSEVPIEETPFFLAGVSGAIMLIAGIVTLGLACYKYKSFWEVKVPPEEEIQGYHTTIKVDNPLAGPPSLDTSPSASPRFGSAIAGDSFGNLADASLPSEGL